MTPMSRHSRSRRPVPSRFGRAAATALAGLLCALALGATALAGVIDVEGDAYRLDGGRPVTGAWEVAEKIAVAKDTAIVVMGKNAKPSAVQNMLQLLESLRVPTVLTKKVDYTPLVERGVLRPTPTP